MTPKVRYAVSADRDAISSLHLASWQVNYGDDVSADVLENVFPYELTQKWAARTFEWPEMILVADHGDGKIAGFFFAYLDRNPAFIDNLHVQPGLQSKGIGASLLQAAFVELRAQGIESASLEVLQSNSRAIDFYLRMGGRDVGPKNAYLFGTPVAARRILFDLTQQV